MADIGMGPRVLKLKYSIMKLNCWSRTAGVTADEKQVGNIPIQTTNSRRSKQEHHQCGNGKKENRKIESVAVEIHILYAEVGFTNVSGMSDVEGQFVIQCKSCTTWQKNMLLKHGFWLFSCKLQQRICFMFFYYYKQHYMNIIYALKNLNNALVTDDFMCAEDEDYDLV